MHQAESRKEAQHATVCCHAFIVYQVCHDVGRCVKMGVLLRPTATKSQWTVLVEYHTISITVRCVIKHVLDDNFYRRRSYASALLGVVILSVCLSHACFVTNSRNLPAIFLYTWKGNPSSCLMPKISAKFQRGYPQQGHQIEVGVVKTAIFDQYWLYVTNGAK